MTVPKLRFPEFRDAEEWEGKTLGAICNCIVPGRDKPKSFTGNIPWITIPDIQGLKIYSSANKLGLSKDEIKECGAKIVPKNSVIMSCVGTFGLISICEQDLVINQQLHAWLPNPKINNYYLAHSLILQKKQMERMATNTTIAYLNKSSCNALKIPLPTLSEQQKIADCLSSIDDRITAETQELDTLKAHKKGLMQQLFPAAGETLPKLRFPEFHDRGDWDEKKIEDLSIRGSGHTPNKKQPIYYNGGIKWVSLADSNKLDNGYIYETKTEISEEGLKNSSAILHPSGTVIVSRDAGVGKSAVLYSEMAVSQHFIAWQCDESKLSNWFLYYFLQVLKPKLKAIATGSTIKTIGLPYFKEICIVIPSISEQEKIADCLSSLDKLITAQTQKIGTLKIHKKGLMQQLFPSPDEVKA